MLDRTENSDSTTYEAVRHISTEESREEHSIASIVYLDPHLGTATKVYDPPLIFRLLYWFSFQSPFPYGRRISSLETAVHRRTIAGLLTKFRFGTNLVAPAISVEVSNGVHSLITEYIPGEKIGSRNEVFKFLKAITEFFTEIGLATWQVSPANPHAYTNLIRTSTGKLTIIDLESAFVIPFPLNGQFLSSWKNGTIPAFDDIDFKKLRSYATVHLESLESNLGSSETDELLNAIEMGEQAMRSWKGAELRLWGKLARLSYFVFNWKGMFNRLRDLLSKSASISAKQ